MIDPAQTDADARRLRTAADDLTRALVLLAACKTTSGGTRTERIMRATPGPAAPGNPRAIHLAVELDGFLHELCADLRDQIEPGRVLEADGIMLTRWIGFNAHVIAATIDWTDDLVDALAGYTARARRVTGTAPRQPPKIEPRQTAAAICQRLASMGHRVTPEQLTLWHHRSAGAVSVEKRGQRNLYLLTEVLDWITRDRPGPRAETQGQTATG
ncbi:hypothetical protein [Corynebacterium lujinxingii]|uniref:Uncharacterized protein n=1 Tax=Corynebacterium lujinxingii TaxID=2763010 RepID=A0A7H0JWP0_9CORY|nr:hypothetical protein [Corynebacterium lujinxingii]MBC3178130.1 hypothetical protein [Corynebacterium lujinxingii]NNO09630.1 hypothetical protein [Corynebacterium lujinxingii]QNP89456.1 hypothetical protein IAU68_07020 [Corynebacterium lujinxingii]